MTIVIIAVSTAYGGQSDMSTTETPTADPLSIEKTPMTRTDTFSFSWTVPLSPEAEILDYLTLQLPKIFETVYAETTGQYRIEEGVAQKVSEDDHSSMRCYVVLDRGEEGEYVDGLALLCYSVVKKDETYISIQVVSTFIDNHSDPDDVRFWFADFTGDGTLAVFSKSTYYAANYILNSAPDSAHTKTKNKDG